MKIWITGIAGFLGSHLADALIAEDHEVGGNDALICGDVENIPEEICWKGTDCRDFDGMKSNFDKFKPEVLVHCAATAHEGLSSFSPSFITRNIYEASVSTFSAAIASGVVRIVYMSSMARYGNQQPPFTEDMLPKPVDPYGVAKVAAEDTLRILAETHGINYSILVPHNIIGIRQRYCDPFRNVASIMMNRIASSEPPVIYGDGRQTRCFSPVKDCIPSIIKAIEGHADGEIVNIGPDKGEITIKELADKILGIFKSPWNALHYPDRPNEVKHAFTSSDKARKLLDYKEKQHLIACLQEMAEDIKLKGIKPFDYSFPLEIDSDKMPLTWKERRM